MNISYYTIDDLRLPPKRSLRKGRSVEQYSTLEEALARYQSLPAAGIRVLGLTDGIHVLELVKCLPLFPDDQEGEDVLALDYGCFPLWAQEPEAASSFTLDLSGLMEESDEDDGAEKEAAAKASILDSFQGIKFSD